MINFGTQQQSSLKKIKHILLGALVAIVFVTFIPDSANAQFYNGLQMQFGKNRVQYREFLWQYYRFEQFDTYFYVNGGELAEFTAEVANEEIPRIENFFQHALEQRIIFIVYNKLSDFRQSNIGLLDEESADNIGGVTQINKNKVFIYFEGNRDKMRRQIVSAISEVVLDEMLYGTNLKEQLANSTLLQLPEWYTKGLFSYLAEDWNFTLENEIRDSYTNNKFIKFNQLQGEEARVAGHSIWKYIADTYGKGTIPNIIYLTRIHKNPEEGFLYVLGISFENLVYSWLYTLKEYYTAETDGFSDPDFGTELFRTKKKARITRLKVSPTEEKIAFVSNKMGQYKIFIFDVKKDKARKIFQREFKLDQITDYSYPLIAWHPSGKILSFIIERKGKILFYLYNIETQELVNNQLFYFEKILDYDYSSDGFSLVLSAYIKGHSDLFIHNLLAHTNQQLTNDFADDLHPRFINNSQQIIFESNRVSDTLDPRIGPDIETQTCTDIFVLDLKNSKTKVLTRISNTPYIDEFRPEEAGKNVFYYLSNQSGIINLYEANFDSTISYIDTTEHYRYFTRSYPLSYFNTNLIDYQSNASNEFAGIFKQNGNYSLRYDSNYSVNERQASPLNQTRFRKKQTKYLMASDSTKQSRLERLEKAIQMIELKQDSVADDKVIDIRDYQFEIEKPYSNARKQILLKEKEKAKFDLPRAVFYNTSFYTNYLVNQIDFSFLNASYQKYTGGAVYYNPGLNFFFKVGLIELFEDYRISGGIRINPDLKSGEYLISLQSLKKRIDEEFIYHRQSFSEVVDNISNKTLTNELIYTRKFPLSQVTALKAGTNLRYDRMITQASDNISLETPDDYEVWGGFKMEYIFDNTRNIAINLYQGLRFKLFAESYFKLNEKSDLYVLGADFRHYLPIHRNIIWANRFAASTSFGNSRLIYYLGSVDNWFNFITGESNFNQSVAIDQTQNYAYQALATNMRGFRQNIRNGNSFALINSELRFPLVRYFWKKPVNSDFFANLQLIGFFDAGTAWSGPDPYARDNAYNYTVQTNGPITIILNKDIDPIVYGYGFGVRTRLLGYFVRADWAWGIEDQIIQPRMFYLSLSLDF